MISGSKLELAERCEGAFTLPHADIKTADTVAGLARHADDEDAINAGDIPEHLEQRYPGYTWRAEVAFAYCCATGEARELGVGIDRQYERFGLSAFEIPCTIDSHGVSPDGLHHVVHDKKSYMEVTPAERNPQLRFGALAVARVYQPQRITVAITHEVVPFDAADLSEFDLDETAHAVRELIVKTADAKRRAAAGEPVEFKRGPHCRWCPVPLALCPEQRDLQALVQLRTNDTKILPFDDDVEAATALEFYERVGVLYKKLGEALDARAARRPIPLGGNRYYGMRPKQGNRKIDGDKAYEYMRQKYGQHIADASIVREASQKKIKEALAFAGVKSIDKALKEIVADLEQSGAVSRKTELKPMEYEDDRPPLRLVEGGGK